MAASNTLCRQDTSTGEDETAGSMSACQAAVTAPEPVTWEEFIQKKKSEIGPDATQTISTFFQPLQQAGDVDSQHLLQELQNDFKKDFLSSCQAVLECLQRLSKQSGLTLVDDEHLNVTLKQAQSKDILISVFGRFNAGKSTLLNAVMADGLLPISIRSQTMAMLKIRHAETIHRGPCRHSEPCDRCPCLVETSMAGERSLNPTQGSERVKNALAAIDKKVKNENQKVTSELIIEANVPILSGVTDPWSIFLVDTPGFGTADKGISQLSKTAMETSQAYVYTMNFKEFDDGSHSKSFQLMQQKDEGVFADGRLLIAVTHFDEYYCHPDEFSSVQEVKEVISQMIKSAVDVPFSEERVIPVCGRWAFYGRQLKCNPDDKDLKKKCLPYLEQCYQGPRGEDKEIPDLPSEEIAKTLETSSDIETLETHVQEMAKSCVAIGIKSLHGDCCRYIKIGSEVLRQRAKLLQECCQAQEKQYQSTVKTQKRLTQQLIDLEGTLKFADSNTVFKELKESYKKDKEIAVGKIKPMAEHLKTDCLKKAQHGSYRISTFWQDVDTFLETATEQLIEGQSFDNIYNYLGNLREKGGGQRNNLWTAAGSYCSADIQTSYVHTEAGHMKQGKDIIESRLHLGELKDDIQIPPATGWFSWMIQNIKNAFSRSTLGTDQLEEVLKQLEDSLTDKCSGYFDEVEPSIVDYFFKHGYCEIAIKGLEDFCKDFDDPMNRKDTSMEMWTRVILLLKTAVQVLQKWEEHLMVLGSHLHEQAGTCLEVEPKTGLPSAQQESHSQADKTKSDTVLPEKLQTLEVAKAIIQRYMYRSELGRTSTLPPPPRKHTPLKMRKRSNTMPTKPPVSSDKSKTVLTDRVKEVFEKELPKSSPPAMLGDLDGDTSDFDDDFKEDFMSTCEAIATRLTKFSEVYPRILTAYSTHLIQRWKQNKQKRIQIGVFGCEKSGKKTLLNAIVANRVLPHGEVVGEVKLKHIVEVHQGPCYSNCEGCPVLFEGDEPGEEICHGSVAISQILKEQKKGKHTCVIGVSCSKLTSIPPWEVHLVYNPPFSLNMEKKGEGKRLKDAVATAQSYVYLLPYTNLENAASSELTKQFIQHSEDIFREAEKVIIALTHFEKWYTTDLEDQRLTIEDLRKKVCKIISETVGIKVSEEVIIPVCAEWGFTARQLQYGSQETEVKEQALKYLQSYTRASGDQYQQLCNLTPTEIGVKLLKASGIQDLEQRLNTPMVLTCIEEAAERLSSDFIAKLTAAIQSLEGHVKAIEEFLEDLSKRLACFQSGQEAYKKYMGVLAQLVQTEPDKSPVYQGIAEHASRDEAKILDEGKAKSHNLLNRFHKECSQRLNQQGENYGLQQLEEDLHKLLPEVSDVIMKCTLSDTAFQGTWESSMEELRKVDQESESTLLSTGNTSRGMNAAKPRRNVEQTFWINLNVLKDRVDVLKSKHQAERVTITENDLASAVRQLEEEIDNLFTSYLSSTKDLVTKQGYKHFRDGVTKIMDGLEVEFELRSQQKDMWQGEPERIKKWQEHLANLRDHLRTLNAEQVEDTAASNL